MDITGRQRNELLPVFLRLDSGRQTLGGSQDVSCAVVANRTAKGSIFRISAFFVEIKALSGRGELRLRSLIVNSTLRQSTPRRRLALCLSRLSRRPPILLIVFLFKWNHLHLGRKQMSELETFQIRVGSWYNGEIILASKFSGK
jgi:hypothetical protein